VDVRVIAATNQDLRARAEQATFRDDLYYRLNVVTIAVPPLRERPADVPLLAHHFLATYARATGKLIDGFAPAAMARLQAHRWPGNVRELEHAVERAVALASSPVILADDLPAEVGTAPAGAPELPAAMTLEELKHWYVNRVLQDTGGNKARAAEVLGIDRKTLYRMLDRQHEGEDAEG
jgi:DNA-binding NtrC family response regulator